LKILLIIQNIIFRLIKENKYQEVKPDSANVCTALAQGVGAG